MPDKTSAIYAEAFRLEGEVARLQSALAAATARADAAIAEIVNEQRRFGEMQREAWKLDAALAAARRECEGLRAMLLNDPKVGSWWQCGNCDGWLVPSGEESNATCAFCAPLRAALAAPAEGT